MLNRIGVHSFVWEGGSSSAAIEQSIVSTAELGYDFLEIGTGAPTALDVKQYECQRRSKNLPYGGVKEGHLATG